ncbi:MAG: GIY-YIG nuclease family protein [Candidatus Peregrinibacteria bacterium]|nr:GIY-YIG nuclease family protein [Candidatus Peregrinibacteria bacterium]
MASHLTSAELLKQAIMFQVYILELANNSYYVGFTENLERRLNEHALGIACSHTKKIPMKRLLWSEHQPDRLKARQREKEIKGWRREKKERLWKSEGSSLP